MQSLAVALTLVLMGKPVFQNKTLAELTADSDFVLEVEKASPFTSARTNAEGCEEKLWRVKVKGIVSVGPNTKDVPDAPKPRATLDVIINPTELFDCMARKRNPSGVSFSAPRYTPAANEPGDRFLLFVNSAKRGYIVTTQNAWDVIEKKSELTSKK
jgi:hypothetical protein